MAERRANVLQVDASIAEAVTRPPGDWVTLGGIVGTATTVSPATGERTAIVTLADFHASIEVLLPARALAAFVPERDDVILVGGRLARRGRRVVLHAQLLERFELAI